MLNKTTLGFTVFLALSNQVQADTTIQPITEDNAITKQFIAGYKQQILDQMIKIDGGEYMMGSDSPSARGIEKPAHKVILDDFYLGKFEMTQDIYSKVMGTNASYFSCESCPVDTTSWLEIDRFIKRLNQLTGKTFRLPTEAEWEFAARGGNKSRGYKYSGSNDINDVAWYSKNSGFKTHDVGTKQPNELGLYDMTGNVSEWCADAAHTQYYSISPVNNPFSETSSDRSYNMRNVRGGSFEYDDNESYVYSRDGSSHNAKVTGMGFRLAMSTMENTPVPPSETPSETPELKKEPKNNQ